MSRKRREEEQQKKKQQRKRTLRALLIALVVVGLVGAAAMGLYLRQQPQTVAASLNDAGDLVFSAATISNARLTTIEFGEQQDVIAWKDRDGNVRTAFNTCMTCYTQGDVGFTKDGTLLACGACEQTVALNSMGESGWGGCSPVAIPAAYRADSGNDIVITADMLRYAWLVFDTWTIGDYSVSLSYYEA